MRCSWGLAAMVIAVAWSSGACNKSEQAGPGYDLKGGEPAAGSVYLTETEMLVTNGKVVVSADGGAVDGSMSMSSRSLERIEVLEAKDGKVSRVMVEILHDVTETVMTIAGETHKDPDRSPLAGETLVGEKSDGLWNFKLQAGEPNKEQLKALADYARIFTDDVSSSEYPNKRVNPGESWDLPPGYVARMLGPEFVNLEGSGVSTLKEVTTDKGRARGLIDSVINIKGTQINPDDGSEVEMEFALQGHHYRDLERLVDMDLNYKGTMRLVTTTVEEGAKMTVEMSGSVVMTGTDSLQ